MFPRDRCGRSILLPIKEESTRLTTSSPFSKRPKWRRVFSGGSFVATHSRPAPEDAYRVCWPCFVFTLTHVLQTTSVPMEQKEEPTQRDVPIVPPRPPARSAGRYPRKLTGKPYLASSRSGLEPSTSSVAVRAVSCAFSPTSGEPTRRETLGSDSHCAPEGWCSQRGTVQA